MTRLEVECVMKGRLSLFRRVEIRSKHRLISKVGLGDHGMDVHEEIGESTGEIREETIRKGAKLAFDVFW